MLFASEAGRADVNDVRFRFDCNTIGKFLLEQAVEAVFANVTETLVEELLRDVLCKESLLSGVVECPPIKFSSCPRDGSRQNEISFRCP